MINLHIVRNSVTIDGRVLRETKSLSDSGFFKRVEICGLAQPSDLYEEVLDERYVWRVALRTRKLPKDLLSQSVKYLEWYCRIIKAYRDKPIMVIHCHDLEPLPIAVRLKKLVGAKIVYDAHELETERNGVHGLRKSLAKWAERSLLRFVDTMITVSPSIRSWYAARFPHIPISLVRNIPPLIESPETPQKLKERLNIPDKTLLFLYLGGLTSGRGIEITLNAFQNPQVLHHIAFMGSGPLSKQIADAQKNCNRIHLLEPVLRGKIIDCSRGADVGICLYEDTCLNHRYCLPNKLFEFLLAGIPVLASDLPDQAELVRSYDAGWVIQNDVEKIVHFLSELSSDEAQRVRNGLNERVKSLRWENEATVLINMYNGLLMTKFRSNFR